MTEYTPGMSPAQGDDDDWDDTVPDDEEMVGSEADGVSTVKTKDCFDQSSQVSFDPLKLIIFQAASVNMNRASNLMIAAS